MSTYLPNYRHPKTTQERRLYDRDEDYVRGKRTRPNLPTNYHDIYVDPKRQYRRKKKKKKRVGGRGKKRTYILNWKTVNFAGYKLVCKFEEYCIAHDIPFQTKRRKSDWVLTWFSDKSIGIERILGHVP